MNDDDVLRKLSGKIEVKKVVPKTMTVAKAVPTNNGPTITELKLLKPPTEEQLRKHEEQRMRWLRGED